MYQLDLAIDKATADLIIADTTDVAFVAEQSTVERFDVTAAEEFIFEFIGCKARGRKTDEVGKINVIRIGVEVNPTPAFSELILNGQQQALLVESRRAENALFAKTQDVDFVAQLERRF